MQLGQELFPESQWRKLYRISSESPLDRHALIDFDDSLRGPSLSRIADNRPNAPGTLAIPGHGITRCEVPDRDIFKPLHYCAISLTDPGRDIEWETRNVVERSSAHLEGLVKRIGPLKSLSFGNLLKQTIVKQKVGSITWSQLWRYRGINNAAKHEYNHPLGTHLFSVRDAVLAYAVARRLGQELYPLADLKTDWRGF